MSTKENRGLRVAKAVSRDIDLTRCKLNGKYLNFVGDSDATCLNCRHDWPVDIECAVCEQPSGPFTKPNHWERG